MVYECTWWRRPVSGYMTQNEVTASLPLLSGTLFSFALSWLRSGSGVVNEQCLTVCFIGAVYRERLPLAAGSWHTLHLPPAKSEWNHTQGDRTERTRSTRLVITFKWDKILFLFQRKKRHIAYKIFHLILGKSREVWTVGDEFQSWLSLNRKENTERNKGRWWNDVSVLAWVKTPDDMFADLPFRYAEYAVLMLLSQTGPNICFIVLLFYFLTPRFP